MKSFVLFSILVSLNCLNYGNIKISNTSRGIRVEGGVSIDRNNTKISASGKNVWYNPKKCYIF